MGCGCERGGGLKGVLGGERCMYGRGLGLGGVSASFLLSMKGCGCRVGGLEGWDYSRRAYVWPFGAVSDGVIEQDVSSSIFDVLE